MGLQAVKKVGKKAKNHAAIMALSASTCLMLACPARAQDGFEMDFSPLSNALFLGFAAAGIVGVFWALCHARALKKQNQAMHLQLYQNAQDIDSYHDLMAMTGQVVVIWHGLHEKPLLIGRLNEKQDMAVEDFLQFSKWLMPRSVRALDHALNVLHQNATRADLTVETLSGRFLQATGRIFGAQAVLRFQDISQALHESAEQKTRADGLAETVGLLQQLLDAAAALSWLRNEKGDITWGNRAFQNAVEAKLDDENLPELLPEPLRKDISDHAPFHGDVTLNIHGERKPFNLTHIQNDAGSGGLAIDKSREQSLASDMQQMARGHADVLDRLSTAVAVFDADQTLQFFNHAFLMLWPLDEKFLETMPSHSRLLDQLRDQGLLAQQPDWAGWKNTLFSVYHKNETNQQIWNLPDGRTLRIIATPMPQGGATWLFDNLTEKLDLETRFNTLIMMQSETLDQLSEGVVVFGSDGRLRLSNPAFAKLWQLPLDYGVEGTHISKIETHCRTITDDPCWADFTTRITGISEERDTVSGRIELKNGTIFDYALVPLPKGQAMLTFVDVTANVKYARTLQEKNEALEAADKLRNDFIQHVSYELRTPLTNIKGFTDLLRTGLAGTLNDKQSDYVKDIGSQSDELLKLVDDILDLATADAGILELSLKPVDVEAAMTQVAERAYERLGKRDVTIRQYIAENLPILMADHARLHQILSNILVNASNFAPDHSEISFKAYQDGDNVAFAVHDDGCGIPEDIVDSVFKRFSAASHHGVRGGAGLGLSIVDSMVKLHHGTVDVETGPERGTTIICRFPMLSNFDNATKPVDGSL